MIEKLKAYNEHWAAMNTLKDEKYFPEMSKGQAPEYLWIGCADSRVPAETLMGLNPGQLFVHRNVANQLKLDDDNAMSVLQYAVDVLKVRHIIICGHSQCGGVKAASEGVKAGFLDSWLSELRELSQENESDYSGDNFVEHLACENVKAQVQNVAASDIVKAAWARNQSLAIHGWKFNIDKGLLQDLDVSLSN